MGTPTPTKAYISLRTTAKTDDRPSTALRNDRGTSETAVDFALARKAVQGRHAAIGSANASPESGHSFFTARERPVVNPHFRPGAAVQAIVASMAASDVHRTHRTYAFSAWAQAPSGVGVSMASRSGARAHDTDRRVSLDAASSPWSSGGAKRTGHVERSAPTETGLSLRVRPCIDRSVAMRLDPATC